MTLSVDPSQLRGVVRSSTYFAMCSVQGRRVVYTTRIPLHDLMDILPIPDPEFVDADNRQVTVRHAKEFGQYLHNPRWVAPPLMVRDAGSCKFTEADGSNGLMGYLEIPWTNSGDSSIAVIDGQHRILGISLEMRRITAQIQNITQSLAKKSTRPQRAERLKAERKELRAYLKRLQSETIGLDIYCESESHLSRQMFVDVADNARGISQAVRSRFDSSRAANRTLDKVMEHPLLRGRVDMERDRMAKGSKNLIGAKHVTDLTRGVMFGISGRTSKLREAAFTDAQVVERVKNFLDCLTTSFPDLAAVADESITPQQLRDRSLLGSSGMLRVLSAVYRNLLERFDAGQEDIAEFFRGLNDHMGAPVAKRSVWRLDDKTSPLFELGAHAPVMRQQSLTVLVDVITGWYERTLDIPHPSSGAEADQAVSASVG
jgi:hypothetical protein